MPFLPRGTAAKQRLYAASSCFACTVAFVLLTTVVIPNSGNLDCDALLYHAVNTNNASDLTTAVSVDAKYALSDFFGAADGVPTAAAFSGGGWKAMAQHMGVVRAINELDGFALPTQLASNRLVPTAPAQAAIEPRRAPHPLSTLWFKSVWPRRLSE
ncbi:hypothetical protein T492DRAFT_146281 [Pavlovales sp. CCMP2436]|nr:hypothetical protein T492DRAFT_146281 [Pavlovales sp. CCMP2436]